MIVGQGQHQDWARCRLAESKSQPHGSHHSLVSRLANMYEWGYQVSAGVDRVAIACISDYVAKDAHPGRGFNCCTR
jgi:hypothetical protein